MAGKDGNISSRIELDGEQEYRKALNDAYRSLKVLRSELRAETAEMGKNASEQEKNRKKTESLKKQIAEQEKIVKTLTKAFKDSQEEYKNNQEVQDKWAEKLNKAREALAKMKSELGDTEDGLKKLSSGMKEAAAGTGEAVQTVTTLKDGLMAAKDVFTGVGSGVADAFSSSMELIKGMVTEMVGLMSEAWVAAGDWKQIQAMFGGDAREIQEIYTGMALQGVNAGDVTAGIQKLVANTGAGNKETIAALKKLHISRKDFASNWDYYIAVMEKLSMYEGNEQDKLSRAIFGEKQGSTQNDVLSNWRDARNKYEQDVQSTGLELTSKQIDELDEVSHKIEEIQELWNRIRMNVGAKLSEILNMDEISEDALELLRDAAKIFSGEGDRKELVMKFSDDLDSFIKDVQAGMGNLSEFLKELSGDLKESDNPLLQFVGRLIDALGDFVTFLEENGPTILEWLTRMLPVITANKVSEVTTGKGLGDWVDTALSTVMNLALFKSLRGGGSGGGGGAGGGGGGSGNGTGDGGLLWLLGWFKTVLPNAIAAVGTWKLTELIPADWITRLTGGTAAEVGEIQKNAGIVRIGDAMAQVEANPEQSKRSLGLMWEALTNPAAGAKKDVAEEVAEAVDEGIQETMTAAQVQAMEAFWDAWRADELAGHTDESQENFIKAWDDYEEAFAGQDSLFDKVDKMLTQFQEDAGSGWTGIEDLPTGWFRDIQGALGNLAKDKYSAGEKEQQQIVVQITANSYLDGELVAQNVSRKLYDGLNHRLFAT